MDSMIYIWIGKLKLPALPAEENSASIKQKITASTELHIRQALYYRRIRAQGKRRIINIKANFFCEQVGARNR